MYGGVISLTGELVHHHPGSCMRVRRVAVQVHCMWLRGKPADFGSQQAPLELCEARFLCMQIIVYHQEI